MLLYFILSPKPGGAVVARGDGSGGGAESGVLVKGQGRTTQFYDHQGYFDDGYDGDDKRLMEDVEAAYHAQKVKRVTTSNRNNNNENNNNNNISNPRSSNNTGRKGSNGMKRKKKGTGYVNKTVDVEAEKAAVAVAAVVDCEEPSSVNVNAGKTRVNMGNEVGRLINGRPGNERKSCVKEDDDDNNDDDDNRNDDDDVQREDVDDIDDDVKTEENDDNDDDEDAAFDKLRETGNEELIEVVASDAAVIPAAAGVAAPVVGVVVDPGMVRPVIPPLVLSSMSP